MRQLQQRTSSSGASRGALLPTNEIDLVDSEEVPRRRRRTVLSVDDEPRYHSFPSTLAAPQRSLLAPNTAVSKLESSTIEGCDEESHLDVDSRGRLIDSDDSSSCNSERSVKPADLLRLARSAMDDASSPDGVLPHAKIGQLILGASGIYIAFLYYGLVQEDLYRYRGPMGEKFTLVWSHQVLESIVAAFIGFVGRTWHQRCCRASGQGSTAAVTTTTASLPSLAPYFQMGVTQLAAKTFISLALEAGVSYPVLTVAKSAKMVPVMLGQLVLGGSSYTTRDCTLAALIVTGSALLSAGESSSRYQLVSSSDTLTGLVCVLFSLFADGLTGGLQKKLQRISTPTTYDLLFFSHVAQFVTALTIGLAVGEIGSGVLPAYLAAHPKVLQLVLASCLSSAIGQCFIFYVISCFDPLVCTTITTTRKMLTVLLSIALRGHDLTRLGAVGLSLACAALVVEMEGKLADRQRAVRSHASTPLLSSATKVKSTATNVPSRNEYRIIYI